MDQANSFAHAYGHWSMPFLQTRESYFQSSGIQSLVGALQYVTIIRPDIAFSVNNFSLL